MSVVAERVRGLLIASTSLALATGAHLLAGGGVPTSALALAVLVASVLPAAAGLARGPLTLGRLLPVLAALQVLLHVEMSTLGGDAHTSAAGGNGDVLRAAHGHAAALAGTTVSHAVSAATTVAGEAAVLPGSAMLVAHAAAVAVTAVVLAAGDRSARRLVAWMSAVALLVRDVQVPALAERPRAIVVDPSPHRLLDALVASTLQLRGPPTASAVWSPTVPAAAS